MYIISSINYVYKLVLIHYTVSDFAYYYLYIIVTTHVIGALQQLQCTVGGLATVAAVA